MKKYIGLSIFALALGLTSCSDSFLDKTPDERVELTSVDDVVMLLGTAYSTANYGWICEISSDNIIDINAPYMATQNNGDELEVRFNLTSYNRMDDEAYRFEPVRSSTSSDSPAEVWENTYHAIAVANHALAKLDELRGRTSLDDPSISNQMRSAYAEAYLTRAYNHFVLVNVFSQAYRDEELSRQDVGVPYSTTPEDKVLVDYQRGSVTETYQKIEEDLLLGLKYLSDANYEKPKWHFNLKAAHAFAARFYLYKREYSKVIEHANFVLGDNTTAGRASLPGLLYQLAGFDNATNSVDCAEIWQGPDQANNLMLVATHSTQWRRSVGYRYATAGKALRDIYYHLGPNWNYYCMRMAAVADKFYWDGNSDHGYMSSRIAERFEYSDKVAGIGYAHIIRREFTASELLLERAEAELLGNNDIDGCVEDLIAYEESRQNFSETTKASYINAMYPLTKERIEKWYTAVDAGNHSNTFADWNFTQEVSPKFVIKPEVLVYMNCINDMRRYETAWTGLRFFDLKRFGIPYSHVYGPEATKYDLRAHDSRLAIELPQEVLLAGLESSRPLESAQGGTSNSTASDGAQYVSK